MGGDALRWEGNRIVWRRIDHTSQTI